MDKKIIIIIVVFAVVLVGVMFLISNAEKSPVADDKKADIVQPVVSVNNFEECVAAGNPVMESFPRQCTTADGATYVEEIYDEDYYDEDYYDEEDFFEEGMMDDEVPAAEAVINAVKAKAAGEAGVGLDEVYVIAQEDRKWSDSCLGLSGEDMVCAMVITPGYEVFVEAGGEAMTFRTNQDGSLVIRN